MIRKSGEPSEFWPKTGTLKEIGMNSFECVVRCASVAGTISRRPRRSGLANATFLCGVRNPRLSLKANAFANGSTRLTGALVSRSESAGTLLSWSWSVQAIQKKTSRAHKSRTSAAERSRSRAAVVLAVAVIRVAKPDQSTQPSPSAGGVSSDRGLPPRALSSTETALGAGSGSRPESTAAEAAMGIESGYWSGCPGTERSGLSQSVRRLCQTIRHQSIPGSH